ncbi:OPT superfamily oligopeptide transporter [Aulographum hederae CBS 113979]|uniref:OPT superfamily oligopeptide transporter n=1 Tax=Aulographum hederae CBS 113979 TaxID=1176131 RepID=A0A6G1HGV2_9PEZI|nr:OPT superfamily oligopeptide transporter [Aulographum hederae CBS 113979]
MANTTGIDETKQHEEALTSIRSRTSTQETPLPEYEAKQRDSGDGITTVDVRENDLEVNSSESKEVVANMEDIALKALHVDDDPTLDPWTFRMFFLGFGLSAFGAALATIFLFKPQSVSVSVIFLTIISYVIGEAMHVFLPKTGWIGRWLNPHPFNSKEHLAIIVMSSSASAAAYATEILATQKLYYNINPNPFVAILLLLSSQLLGYGMAGILRKSLVYPTKMIYPSILPLSSLVEVLHREKDEMKKRFNIFWIILGGVAVWELFPQYIMPILTGVSVFCLANRKSLLFTRLFGGASGNEGLGLLSLCFDWQYVGTSALYLPLVTLTNGFIGFILCMALFMGVFYGNVWNALQFPFLSQQLFSPTSNSSSYAVYNQSLILNADLELDERKLAVQGIPFFAATNASYLLTTNLGIAATLVHVMLWNYDAVKDAFSIFNMKSLKAFTKNPKFWQKKSGSSQNEKVVCDDPHYLLMQRYKEVPSWWYLATLVISVVVALICIYALKSTLPWWGFLVACILSFLTTLFFGAMAGLIGFSVPITNVIQLIGGYLHPGKPVANMYFVLFGANAQAQALYLIQNLKLGQYGKLSPRCTFTVQIIGTVFGAILNYVLMNSITDNQREILLSIQGTNVWSGQVIQSFNSNAIAFGALSKYMFAASRTYLWVVLALPVGLLVPLLTYFLHRLFPRAGFDYLITPVICWYLGFLSVGINSSLTFYFAIGFFVQYYVRKRYPRGFLKYNYLIAAAISGGTEVLVFVTTFAVQGGSGKERPFPPYWGNNFQDGNVDYCMRDPGLG